MEIMFISDQIDIISLDMPCLLMNLNLPLSEEVYLKKIPLQKETMLIMGIAS